MLKTETTKLSERLRPNVECAPWVIAEVKKLEQEIERLEREIDSTHSHYQEQSND